MDGGAWWAAVYGVAKSQTQLSDLAAAAAAAAFTVNINIQIVKTNIY